MRGKVTKILVLVSVYTAITLVSVGVAAIGFVWYRIEPAVSQALLARPTASDAENQSSLFLTGDRDLGFRPVPLVHFTKRDHHGTVTEIATDSRGFRIDPDRRAESESIDMLVVGCSQTWGHGIRYADT